MTVPGGLWVPDGVTVPGGVSTGRFGRVSPYEIALLLLGVALIVAAVLGSAWANNAISLANAGYYCDASGHCAELYDFVLTKTILNLAPGVVGAGILAIIVVIALRALSIITQRRIRAAAGIGPRTAGSASSKRAASGTDHSPFMRPPGD